MHKTTATLPLFFPILWIVYYKMLKIPKISIDKTSSKKAKAELKNSDDELLSAVIQEDSRDFLKLCCSLATAWSPPFPGQLQKRRAVAHLHN